MKNALLFPMRKAFKYKGYLGDVLSLLFQKVLIANYVHCHSQNHRVMGS